MEKSKAVLFILTFMMTGSSPGADENLNDFSFTSVIKEKIVINGTKRFTQQVVKCLDLMAEKDNKEYQFVNKYIGEIRQHHTSGMDASANPPRFEMSTKTAFYSLTWCASSISHDAYHSYLYQLHKPKDGSKTKNHYWSGVKPESLAILHQRIVAKKIGSSVYEIDYLMNLKGTHADLDGDGSITHEDYKKRDW